MLMDTKVLLADDHRLLREGLRLVLDVQPGITVVGEAEDGRQAVEMAEELHPDVVVMDIAMPNLNGLEAARHIKRTHPDVKIVILTMHENRHYFREIVRLGVAGCVLKRSAATELVAAIRAAAHGHTFYSPAVTSFLLADYRALPGNGYVDPVEGLTIREREVLTLVADGKTNQEIATALDVSIKTVQTHRAHLMQKLGTHDRTELVKYAMHKEPARL
jgi:DNA-binding NarL/FixJ family response regulator